MLIPDIHKPAPPFSGPAVVDGQFKEVSLSMFQSKYLVLLFYPLDFTFVCPTELFAYSDRLNEFRECECEVVAVSTDSEYCHLAWANVPKEEGGLAGVKVPLLSDKSTKISRAYGVLDEETGTAFRGLFIIDDRGLVRQVTINDLQVGRSVDETLRLVQAFRHVDKYGEVCPAGWRPGAPAIPIDEQRRSSAKSTEDGVGEGIDGSLRPSSRSSNSQRSSSRASQLSGAS
ncbi:peroxiredoxin-2-like isoform X2 [Nilaparvata lugens]|uniref:peroxiredoxin-2-like isoform X2 n=1 Tax=Nilaparvata lugens TaxID=108931 RepID=UPI000B98B066|nr:peroxiredoxin-2-like isoform X2 [Nilaparvata lugens]XP_039293999.1 peroxiredoxin-2-like isoform X2 [Nilaparvata lugens]XP_039294000.1 peroxiredoxin-2-like isoform X2 [Nilaparvata lugens]XP_039294001.1 peroxiredoxin-2-like isoform X2 [Nilaparvata lugens]XP_039294002.1 peroxiredoxin-2-like isoform X2 [Nilaparvata lugens]